VVVVQLQPVDLLVAAMAAQVVQAYRQA